MRSDLSLIQRCLTSVALALILAGGLQAEENYAPQVGQRHPNITLPTIHDGSAVSLSDFRGKKVLLIHFASW
jgi:peroxiredoxin